MERESTQGGEELGFGHRAKVSRCDDRAPLRQRASMTEKRLTARACCHRDRVRADRFPPSLTPSPPWRARTRRGWRRRRSEERRLGEECVRTGRSRWSAYHLKKKT